MAMGTRVKRRRQQELFYAAEVAEAPGVFDTPAEQTYTRGCRPKQHATRTHAPVRDISTTSANLFFFGFSTAETFERSAGVKPNTRR